MQDPRTPTTPYDLVVPPRHDRLSGDNVVAITGSPNRLSPERLAQDRARFAAQIDPLPHPRVAIAVGGKSRAFDLSAQSAARMARDAFTEGDEVATVIRKALQSALR